jgi:thiamine biosynthesis lipoprotein
MDADWPDRTCRRTERLLGTFVTLEVVCPSGAAGGPDPVAALDRAFEWVRAVEQCCSRFDATSEVRRLRITVGTPVRVSRMLFEALQFAVTLAEDTGGAFDPTVGGDMAARGFDRHYLTGERAGRDNDRSGAAPSYRDITLDPGALTVTLHRPLALDLGAVAKGLAIDMAAHELRDFAHFTIDAGGDLFLGGCRPDGGAWAVGIRHPRLDHDLVATVRVVNRAVCTSGDYARPDRTRPGEHHLLDGRTRQSARASASVTVVAPTAMLADAVSTAVFVLGPAEGLLLCERLGVDGLIVDADLRPSATPGMYSDYHLVVPRAPSVGTAPVLPHA